MEATVFNPAQVYLLHMFERIKTDEELLEIFMIVGAVLLVDLERGGVDSVEGIHTDAALEAAAGLLAEESLHLDLLDQVVSALMKVGEAVDGLAGQVGRRSHQILVLVVLCEFIGHRQAVDGGTDDRMVDPVVDFFTEHVDSRAELAQGFDVLFCSHKCHSVIPPCRMCW